MQQERPEPSRLVESFGKPLQCQLLGSIQGDRLVRGDGNLSKGVTVPFDLFTLQEPLCDQSLQSCMGVGKFPAQFTQSGLLDACKIG